MDEISRLEQLAEDYTTDGLTSTFVELESLDSSFIQCERKMLLLKSVLNKITDRTEITEKESTQFSRWVYIRVKASEYVKPFKLTRLFTAENRHYIVDNTGAVLCLETNVEMLEENMRLIEQMKHYTASDRAKTSTMIRTVNDSILSTIYPLY